jgi:hypothetical protein
VDLIPANSAYHWNANGVLIPLLPGIKPSEGPAQEVMAIKALTLKQFHHICDWNLSRRRNFDCSTSATVNLTAIITCASGDRLEDLVEVALLPDAVVRLGYWRTTGGTGEVMDGDWTRYYDFILAAW